MSNKTLYRIALLVIAVYLFAPVAIPWPAIAYQIPLIAYYIALGFTLSRSI